MKHRFAWVSGIAIFLISMLVLAPLAEAMSHQEIKEYFQKYYNVLIHVARQTGVPPSLQVAQAIKEQGGAEAFAIENNNWWGVKTSNLGKKYSAGSVSASTSEAIGGKQNQSFSKLPSLGVGLAYHSDIFFNSVYDKTRPAFGSQEGPRTVLRDINSPVDEAFIKRLFTAISKSAYFTGNCKKDTNCVANYAGQKSYFDTMMQVYKELNLAEWDAEAFPGGKRLCAGKYKETPEVGDCSKYPDDQFKNVDIKVNTEGGSPSGGVALAAGSVKGASSEWELVGMPARYVPAEGANVEFTGVDSLSSAERYNLYTWKTDKASLEAYHRIDLARTFIMFLGIAVMFWSALLLLAWALDRAFPIAAGKFTWLVTFTRYHYSQDADDFRSGNRKYVTTKGIFKASLFGTIVSALIITGAMTKYSMLAINWVMGILTTP